MNTEANKRIMAENIKRYMDKKGVTNQQLCDALGFKYTTFMDWIKAVTYPRIGRVEAMANYFGCEKSDLIEEQKEHRIGEKRKALIDFAMSVPEDKAEMILRVMKSILDDE